VNFLHEHSETARKYQFVRIFEQFQKSLINELDYQREVANLWMASSTPIPTREMYF
jgi:predicted unusual protein kinase regulating ubiquinone biosynthesis (AarF/ABC1/UbiB family)